MDIVEGLVKEDQSICGMWCVPKFSNPTGEVYSNEVVERIARLGKIANPNFRIFWDNAYAAHDLEDGIYLTNIFEIARELNTLDAIVEFSSTSKITFAGAGIGFMASSEENLNQFKKYLAIQTIGPDKINQMRHVEFFKSEEGIKKHMLQHRELIKPKFDLTIKILNEEFSNSEALSWTEPKGGYFISVNTKPGLATKVVKMCDSLGVKFTPAGSTYPHMKDPEDSNIRIAPSMPSLEAIETAMRVFSTVVKHCSLT